MGIYSNSNIHEEYAELVNRVQSGDENAFAEIYQKSERLVYTTCYEVLHSKEDAEDAMQDTYAALFENIANIKEGKALVDWIKTTAYYKAVHIRDKNKPDVAYEDALVNEEISEVDDNLDILPESYVTDKANRAIIRDILRQKLSDDQYDAILLYYYSEMPVSQIAEVMHCPEGTVKTRLSEGRKKIKKGIESYEKLHGDRLAGAAGVPFLTRFFIESAKELTLPVINPFPVNIPATPSAVGELTETGAKAGKLAQATSNAGELSETGEPMSELAKGASKTGSFAKNAGTAGSGAKAGVLASPLAKIGIAVLALAVVAVPTVIAVKNIKKTADEMRDEKISEIEEETEKTEGNVDPVVTSETDEPSLDDKVKSSYLQVVTEHESGIRTHEQYSQQGLELVPPVKSINYLDINSDGINEMIFMECDSAEECTLSIYTYDIETESAELMVNSLMSEPSIWSWREILMLDNGNLLVITYDSYRGNYREGMVEYQIDNTELVAVNEWIAYGCRMWYGETDLHPFSNVYLNEQLSSESEYLAAVQEYAAHVISPVYPIACRFENDGFICDHDVLCTDTFDFYGPTFKKGNYYLYDDFVAMLKGEIPGPTVSVTDPVVTSVPEKGHYHVIEFNLTPDGTGSDLHGYNKWDYEYDANDRLIKATQLKTGYLEIPSSSRSVSELQKIIEEIDAEEDSVSQWREYEYDSSDNLIKLTSYSGDGSIMSWTEYEYDRSNNMIKETNYGKNGTPDKTTEYEYDNSNNLIKETQDFKSFEYQYDSSNRLIKKKEYGNYGDLVSYVEYEYDNSNNVVKETTYHSDDRIAYWTEYQYDSSNNLVKELFYYIADIAEYTTYYSYDENSKLILIDFVWAGGHKLTIYEYIYE